MGSKTCIYLTGIYRFSFYDQREAVVQRCSVKKLLLEISQALGLQRY